MKRSDAEKLLQFVNSVDNITAIETYMNLRIDYLKNSLVTAITIDDVRRYQGAIEELTRLQHLRNEVLNPRE